MEIIKDRPEADIALFAREHELEDAAREAGRLLLKPEFASVMVLRESKTLEESAHRALRMFNWTGGSNRFTIIGSKTYEEFEDAASESNKPLAERELPSS